MKLISHRGNLNGSMFLLENTPKYIDIALKKFDCEVDVWFLNGQFFLSHDEPKTKMPTPIDFFLERKNKLWIHCKNLEALSEFKKYKKQFNYFFHSIDQYTITSKGFIWANIEVPYNKDCIIVEDGLKKIGEVGGICSDNIEYYARKIV